MSYDEFKTFAKQFRECREDATAFDEKTHCCGQIIIMCKRFAGQCSAAKCLSLIHISEPTRPY